MRVYNKSKRMYEHGEYKLAPGSDIKVPDEVAEIWLATGDIVEYVDPDEAKKAEAKAAENLKSLEDENAKLKAELAALKAKIAKVDEEAKDEAKKAEAKAKK